MKTPPQKKSLSYAKDRRNTYGENNKGSRKTIQKNKAFEIRAERHTQNQRLTVALSSTDSTDDLVQVENTVRDTKPRQWKKSPDTPLGEVVTMTLEQRKYRIGTKIERAKVRNAT
jgi:hypothetical protein